MSSLAIIGIGNSLMSDDGIGPRLLKELRVHSQFKDDPDATGRPQVDLIELGSGGMSVLHYLAQYKRAIIVDSGNMDLSPGEFRVFSPDEVTSVKFLSGQSLHEFDLLQAISMSQKLGECPDELMIMAIQPVTVGWGEGLSLELEKNVPIYLSELVTLANRLMKSDSDDKEVE